MSTVATGPSQDYQAAPSPIISLIGPEHAQELGVNKAQ